MELVGYLVKPEFIELYDRITCAGKIFYSDNGINVSFYKDSERERDLKELNILDLITDPVYEEPFKIDSYVHVTYGGGQYTTHTQLKDKYPNYAYKEYLPKSTGKVFGYEYLEPNKEWVVLLLDPQNKLYAFEISDKFINCFQEATLQQAITAGFGLKFEITLLDNKAFDEQGDDITKTLLTMLK